MLFKNRDLGVGKSNRRWKVIIFVRHGRGKDDVEAKVKSNMRHQVAL